jgi:hypothetical protein
MRVCVCIVLVVVGTMGCSFTIPSPPVETSRDPTTGKFTPSIAAKAMARLADDVDAKDLVLDEAMRCEGRLNALTAKMRSERAGRATFTVGGGVVAASGGVLAVALKDDDAKTASAIVAAVGGVIAIASQLVGDPAKEMELYQKALGHYEKAKSLAADGFGGPMCAQRSPVCFAIIRSELALCSDENAGGTTYAERTEVVRPPVPTATAALPPNDIADGGAAK